MLGLIKQGLICFSVTIFVSCVNFNADKLIPITKFLEPQATANFHISQNGVHVAYVKSGKNTSSIFLKSLKTGKVSQLCNLKSGSIKSYFWVNSQTLFYIIKDKFGNALYQVNINGKGNKKNLQAYTIDFVDKKIWNNNILLLAIKQTNSQPLNAYKVSINNWQQEIIALNTGNIVHWVADNLGNVKLAIANMGVQKSILYRNTQKDVFKPILNFDFNTTITPICFKNNNSSIYALSNLGRDKSALVVINCLSGLETEVIKASKQVDIIEVNFKNNKPIAVVIEAQKKENYYFSVLNKTLSQKIKKQLNATHLDILEVDDNENNYLVKVYSDKLNDTYFAYNKKNKTIIKLSPAPIIAEADLCDTKPISFLSRDSVTINGYITLPKQDKYNLACVVLPHTLTNGRDSWQYLPEVQFLASRGYAVLQINYRGSCGYGKRFKKAGYKQLNKLVQNDITDGTKWLIEKRIATASKIAIYGFGFGGFFALNGAINNPGMYACVASYSGITNLFAYLKGDNLHNNVSVPILNTTIGNPLTDAHYLSQASPIFYSTKINIPLLIAQGTKDKITSVNETNQFVKELRKRDINVKYLLNDNEGHNFEQPSSKLEFYQTLEKFLAQNLD